MPSLNYQAGRPPLVSYPRIFVQNILSYFPYMEAVFCIGNMKDFTFQLLCKFARLKHNTFVFKNCIASYIDAFL